MKQAQAFLFLSHCSSEAAVTAHTILTNLSQEWLTTAKSSDQSGQKEAPELPLGSLPLAGSRTADTHCRPNCIRSIATVMAAVFTGIPCEGDYCGNQGSTCN